MSARFVSAELSYGCQRGRVELGPDGRPCVLAGPNGSGKTTLVEGIVRTLYGFNRQRRDERDRAERREPWDGETFSGRVLIERSDGCRAEVTRHLDTDHVTVRRLAGEGQPRDTVLFEGIAKPGSGRREAERYREILVQWLGFGDLDDYRRTMCIEQGELVSTELADYLLQLAAGGHAALDLAKETLQTTFRALTREPLEPGDRRRPKDKLLEVIREEIGELDARLQIARRVERNRQPLRQEERDLSGRKQDLTASILVLEDALDPLATLEKLRDQSFTLDERVHRLERHQKQLGERLEGLRRAGSEWERISAEPLYPDNFHSRLDFLHKLWEDASESARECRAIANEVSGQKGRTGIPVGLIVAGILGLVGGRFLGGPLSALVPALGFVALVAGGFLQWYRRDQARLRERRLAEAEIRHARIASRITEQLEGVPDGETLTPESASDRLERFRLQRSALEELQRLRASVDELLATIEIELPSQGELPLSQRPTPEELERAVAVTPILDNEVSRARTELAQRRIELERAEAVAIRLPDGVEPDYGAVRATLESLRAVHRDAGNRLAELRRRLLEAETGESPLSLVDALDGLRAREAKLISEVEALRAAFELLTDAYTEFRASDQERLLAAVSAQLERVSGGTLGPVETDSVLEAAHVMVGNRRLPLDSPPLSFGELHAVLLAVRLGAADFLAGSGHRAPLLIDEPFTYLDDERAAQVWAQLQEVARERQIVITTQARRLLAHLDVEPDLQLATPERVEPSPARGSATSP